MQCYGDCQDCPKNENCELKEALEYNMYFTLRGCEASGHRKIPETLFRFIGNIAGLCTDKYESEDYYKNPRAMFVALDLIYKACSLLNEESVNEDRGSTEENAKKKP
ncbi:hypothetical protein MUP77_17190 [Candidatus Bathyarchaeota archaeon]|nr:hypothetical protein [Candidatus Bathyarchaeota archaeon]